MPVGLSRLLFASLLAYFVVVASCATNNYHRERDEHSGLKWRATLYKEENARLRSALSLAIEQRKFWHQEYLNCEGTPNDGGEQQAEDDYQIEQELRVDDEST